MDIHQILDANIESSQLLMTPIQLKEELPLTESAASTVLQGRQDIQNILECLGWKETEEIVLDAHQKLRANRDVTLYACGLVLSGTPVRNLLATRG